MVYRFSFQAKVWIQIFFKNPFCCLWNIGSLVKWTCSFQVWLPMDNKASCHHTGVSALKEGTEGSETTKGS